MQYSIHPGSDERLQVDLSGRFDYTDSLAYRVIVKTLMANKDCDRVQMNLQNLESIDCTAGQLLMMMHDVAKKSHCSLVFVGAQGQVLDKLKDYARHNALRIAA